MRISRTAVWSFTGTLVSPKWITPFHNALPATRPPVSSAEIFSIGLVIR